MSDDFFIERGTIMAKSGKDKKKEPKKKIIAGKSTAAAQSVGTTTARFIKFMRHEPTRTPPVYVAVAISHISRIEADLYELGPDGDFFIVQVAQEGHDYKTLYEVFDSNGNMFDSLSATDESKKIIEELWNEAQ